MGLSLQASSNNLYFTTMADYLASAIVTGFLEPHNLKDITNKKLYTYFSNFPLPKVVRDAPSKVDFRSVWERLYSGVLNMEERQICYLLIHNKLPIQERLFRISINNDPYCTVCLEAVVADREHTFCDCLMVHGAWI